MPEISTTSMIKFKCYEARNFAKKPAVYAGSCKCATCNSFTEIEDNFCRVCGQRFKTEEEIKHGKY